MSLKMSGKYDLSAVNYNIAGDYMLVVWVEKLLSEVASL